MENLNLNDDEDCDVKIEEELNSYVPFKCEQVEHKEVRKSDYNRHLSGTQSTDVKINEELNSYFPFKCEQVEHKVVRKSEYILHLSGTQSTSFKVMISDSSRRFGVYDFHNGRIEATNGYGLNSDIVGIKACSVNENLFFVGTANCEIRLCDVRDPLPSKSLFEDTTKENDAKRMPMTCFDTSSNNVLLCAGTELYDADSYILFWDIRNTKLMGAYWESHTDEITQVRFHPDDSNKLMSGSVDGLINIYDLRKTHPDDALTDTLNTESSIDRLYWYGRRYDSICCITQTDEVQLWKLDDAAPSAHFQRDAFTEVMQRTSNHTTYVGDAYVNRNQDLSILAGSTWRNEHCLLGLRVEKERLVPRYNFKENNQLVRSCWFNQSANILVTGGEGGCIDVWDIEENNCNSHVVRSEKKM